MPFHYAFGPFELLSELELVELCPTPDPHPDPTPDPHPDPTPASAPAIPRTQVQIDLGPVPRQLAGMQTFDPLCSVGPHDYLLHIPDVARFHASHGTHVRVELAPTATAPEVSAFLLGSVFGALCHQNGMLPLHASSIVAGTAVTAFLGDSGAGKSTLAASLQERGYPVFSDDICLLKPNAQELQALPLAGWLKLWRQSVDHLHLQASDGARIFAKQDKFRMPVHEAASHPLPLRTLVFLERGELQTEQPPRLTPMPAAETLARMMELTYLAYLPALNGQQTTLFKLCGRALTQARAYRLELPWDLGRLGETVELLERELLA